MSVPACATLPRPCGGLVVKAGKPLKTAEQACRECVGEADGHATLVLVHKQEVHVVFGSRRKATNYLNAM